MAIGLGIGNDIPSGALNSNRAPILDFRIISENGDFLLSESELFIIPE